MNETTALQKMILPKHKRPGKPLGGVIQIWVTRACDRSCFGCTQGSNLAGKPKFITVKQFEQACKSLQDYWGIVGVFGGNPAIHPQFETLCEIIKQYIPKERCGLWCNNPFNKAAVMRETFNPSVSNLNVHLDLKAYNRFKKGWPESNPFGLHDDSRHSPPYIALQDIISDEEKRWELITNCDINQHWSAMICVFHGELRGFFCEIAGAQAMLYQDDPNHPDLGLEVTNDWWKKPIQDFSKQVKQYCHACGVPLKAYGELACSESGFERTSKTHKDIYKPKTKNRPVKVLESLDQLGKILNTRMTDYLGNAKK